MGSDRRLRTVLLLHAALWLALLSETAQGAMQSASEALHVHAAVSYTHLTLPTKASLPTKA